VHYGAPTISNTDQGAQFTANAFTSVLKAAGVSISLDGRGAWRDNVFIDRFWWTLKHEEVYLKAYDSVRNARRHIGAYIGLLQSRALAFQPEQPHPSRGLHSFSTASSGTVAACSNQVRDTGHEPVIKPKNQEETSNRRGPPLCEAPVRWLGFVIMPGAVWMLRKRDCVFPLKKPCEVAGRESTG